MSSRRFTFQNKLLTGFGLMAMLLVTLLLIGSRIIQQATFQLSQVFHTEVQPLARANRLQLQINRLQLREVNLPLLSDIFAVSSETDLIRTEAAEFSRALDRFNSDMEPMYPLETQSLSENWKRLQSDLTQVTMLANEMNMAEVVSISAYQSSGRFVSVRSTLQTLVDTIEASSHRAYESALEDLDQRHQLFITTALAVLIIGSLSIFLFARSLSRRVRHLRDASTRIADGEMDAAMEISGNDELTDLAIAFDTMKQKVRKREIALNQARNYLEQRVHERTLELYTANQQLTREVEERKKAQESRRILSLAVRQSPVGVIITDKDGYIEYVNEAFSTISGFAEEEVLGRTPRLLNSGETSATVYEELWSTIAAGNEWEGMLYNRRKDGSFYWENTHISPVHNEEHRITHFLAIKQDVTIRREQEQKILHQAQYDALTNLPNRTLAMDRLKYAIVNARRNCSKVMLMFIDLDDFKRINDNFGHESGDQLLIQAACRLTRSVRQEDTVARLGGDEFLVIAGDLAERVDVGPIVDSIMQAFCSAFSIDGCEQVVTPSIGIALFPEDGVSTSILLRNADLAMYQAKEDGRNTYHFFDHRIQEKIREKLELESELRHALSRNELRLQYQTIVDIGSNRIVGVEALLRWHSSKFGLVMPDRFINIAEQTGLIEPIGEWVLEAACAQVRYWHERGMEDLKLSVNVSPRQFRGGRLMAVVQRSLQQSGFPASKLTLEVTEGLLVRNSPEALRLLTELVDLEVQLAMDDFGTGYSSLSYLKKYPFHILKIDRTFVRDIVDDPEDRALVTAAASMGKSLGLTVVAEGVETRQQLDILCNSQCDWVQGYLLSKPLSAEELEQQWFA